ncbi:26S proteasome non-ATPase regulatory subunit 9, partial [Chytridiales sp. JEL 0842]
MMTTASATSTDTRADSSDARVELELLSTRKKDLEREIDDLFEILNEAKVGLDDPLVDAEGYPRADVDVYSIRHVRSKLRQLQNDHKSLMKELEGCVQTIFSQANASRPANAPPPTGYLPFALVNSVADNSPASTAGLCAGDKVLKFGNVTKETGGIGALAALVTANEN